MVFSVEDQILIKSLYFSAKRLIDEFPENSWTKCAVNKLLKKVRDIEPPKCYHTTAGFSKKITMLLYA